MKESDIRPGALYQKYLELSQRDALIYFGSSGRQPLPCPACGHDHKYPAFEKCGFNYVVCQQCGTLYQSPRPPQEDFARFYRESSSAHYWANTFFPAVAEIRRRNLFQPKVAKIAQLCEEDRFFPEVVADVGAGYGLFLEEWRNRFPHTELIAIEPHPDLADLCRSKKFIVAECFAEEATHIHGQVDLVVAQEVIEHVYEPLAFCVSLRQLLRLGGKALLTDLTLDGFDIQVLWQHSKSICPPLHINFMSIRGFEFLLNRAGFANVRIFTPGKLDVDIVKNALSEKPDILNDQRFIRHLLTQGDNVLTAFQNFLTEHRLSSHCWIWAAV